MTKPIKIFGAGHGRTEALAEAAIRAKTGNKIIIIGGSEPIEQTFDVGGEMYRKKPQLERTSGISSIFNHFIASGAGFDFGKPHQKQRPNVDILSEYRLILKKKSNLSKSNREWVAAQFKNYFEKI